MKTIAAVPESITRQAYIDLIASIGFDANSLRKLEFRMDGIYAEVMDRDPTTGRILLEGGSSDEVALNRVWIPVKNG